MASATIPDQMLAVQVTEFNKPYQIDHVPVPKKLDDHDLLIKTAAASLCHTDLMVLEGTFSTSLPCTGSHEGTGVVVAVGQKVSKFKVGDRVMSGLHRNQCGDCAHCWGPNDWHQYCESMNGGGVLGINRSGAFAEYHIVDERTSCHVPDDVSFTTAAPMACAGATSYRAVIVSNVKPGGWLGIVGAGGGLGHLAVQFAKARGIKVVAVDARDEGLEVCRRAMPDKLCDARHGSVIIEEIRELTDGGVDSTINVSDHPTAAPLACAITRVHGSVVQVAQPEKVSIPFQEIILRDITIKSSMLAGQEQCQEMLIEAAKHGYKVECQIFRGLEEVPTMVRLLQSGEIRGKAVVVVDGSLI